MTTDELDDFYSEIERSGMHIEEPFQPNKTYKKAAKKQRLNSKHYFLNYTFEDENVINVKPKTLRMTNPEDYY